MHKIAIKALASIAAPLIMYSLFCFVIGSGSWVTIQNVDYVLTRFFYVVATLVLTILIWGGEYL